jgi:hypothetical protein
MVGSGSKIWIRFRFFRGQIRIRIKMIWIRNHDNTYINYLQLAPLKLSLKNVEIQAPSSSSSETFAHQESEHVHQVSWLDLILVHNIGLPLVPLNRTNWLLLWFFSLLLVSLYTSLAEVVKIKNRFN